MGDSNVPDVPLDPNQGAAAQGAFQGIQGLSKYQPYYQGAYDKQANNPYAGQAVQGAEVAGQAGIAQGHQNISTGADLTSQAPQFFNRASQALNDGFDPQNQLRNREQQRLDDTVGARNASLGIGTSPFGAGVANEADKNFGLDWLDRIVGREHTAAGTAATLAGQGTSLDQAGANLGASGARQLSEGASLPYSTQTGVNNDLNSLLQLLTTIPQGQIKDYLSYGQNANAQATNSINAGKAQDAADQAFGNGIGSALGVGAKLFAL